MNIVKQILISTALLPTLALAQGGNDPVPGIDVIIKREGVFKKVELDDRHLAQVSALKDEARSNYLAKVLPPMINKAMEGKLDEKELQQVLHKQLLANRCDPCRDFETFSYTEKDSRTKATYNLRFNLYTDVKVQKPHVQLDKLNFKKHVH